MTSQPELPQTYGCTGPAEHVSALIQAMRALRPAFDAAARQGVVPTGSFALQARIFWMRSQAALASATAGLPARATLDELARQAADHVGLAPHILSTLRIDRARRQRAPLWPGPVPHGELVR